MVDAPKKLVTLKSPSVGFTGARIVNPTRLTRNFTLGAGESLKSGMVDKVQEGDRHVVLNCHGHSTTDTQPAYLELGQSLWLGNADVCYPWTFIGSLRVIWLSACNIGGSGMPFCERLAYITQCYVVTNMMFVYDRPVKPNTIEDNYYAKPIYVAPSGKKILREDFAKMSGEFGFAFPAA
jgi:hypothetical protein